MAYCSNNYQVIVYRVSLRIELEIFQSKHKMVLINDLEQFYFTRGPAIKTTLSFIS